MATKAKTKLDTKIIHSLDKGLEVLELVAFWEGDVGLSELAERLRWDKATIFRLLTTLIRRGYVEQDRDTKRYRLGLRILRLENHLMKSLDLAGRSRQVLAKLALATSESAHLATLEQDRAVIIAQRESPARVAANVQVGMAEPLHCTALGKALLMQMPDELLKKTIGSLDLKPYTENTITSPEWLLNHLQKIRDQGYALDEEEYDPQVRCIAVPLRIPGLRQYYALGISGPASRVAAGRLPVLVRHVLEAAQELFLEFGGEPEERRNGTTKRASQKTGRLSPRTVS